MNRSRLLIALLLGSSLILFGFGCKKPAAPKMYTDFEAMMPKTPALVQKTTAPAAAPTPTKTADPNAYYLREVMKNFDRVKSYKAVVTIPTPDGPVTGNIEFVRTTGLHGLLLFSQNRKTEIYLLGEDIYFRVNTSSWENLSATPEGKQVSVLFQSAFSLGDNGSAAILPESARVVGTANDPSGCRLFLVASDSPQVPLQICVKNDLPVRVTSPASAGPVEVRYSDYDKPITLVAPIKK